MYGFYGAIICSDYDRPGRETREQQPPEFREKSKKILHIITGDLYVPKMYVPKMKKHP